MFDDITKSEFNPMYHIEKIRKVEIWGDLVRGVNGWFTPFLKKITQPLDRKVKLS
jgi:hypothetical protein